MIKIFILLIAFASSLFSFNYNLKPKKIANSVYMFTGVNEPVKKSNGGAIANSYWIKTNKHWVVFDSGPTYDYAKQAHEAMKKIANLPIDMVFNSHFHDDHWMGNSYYKELKVPIYATKQQKEEYKPGAKSRVLKILDKKDLVNTKIVTPDKIVDKSFNFKVDNTDFEVIKLKKPAHSKEDFMLYMPKEKILFTGDILMSERITSIRHGSVKGNLEAISLIEKINPKIYANGHGKFTDKTALNLTKSYLQKLAKEAKKAIENDIEVEDFIKKADFSEFKNYKLFNVAHKENMFAAFNEFFDE